MSDNYIITWFVGGFFNLRQAEKSLPRLSQQLLAIHSMVSFHSYAALDKIQILD